MTLQRRRGQPALIWQTELVQDRRGNEVRRPTSDPPLNVRVWVIPQRSARAEVPGQQQIDVVRIGSEANLTDVDLWSRVEWNGRLWDVVTPPAYHHGTRHVRHWSIDLRERPEAVDG